MGTPIALASTQHILLSYAAVAAFNSNPWLSLWNAHTISRYLRRSLLPARLEMLLNTGAKNEEALSLSMKKERMDMR